MTRMERPILFSGVMVKAILAGTKTQTRRLLRGPVPSSMPNHSALYGTIGDGLWIREAWRTMERAFDLVDGVLFAADGAFVPIKSTPEAAVQWVVAHDNGRHGERWRPGIHMPRWASRIMLEVTSVRVERLQAITEEDARAEGVEPGSVASAAEKFAWLWDEINGRRAAWASNPWVWRVAFRRVDAEARAA